MAVSCQNISFKATYVNLMMANEEIHPVGFGQHPKSHAISKQETHDGLMLKQLHAHMPRKMWAQKCRQTALEM